MYLDSSSANCSVLSLMYEQIAQEVIGLLQKVSWCAKDSHKQNLLQ